MQKKGFTLLEVLVAATIMLVLTAVGMTSYSSVTRKSRDARRISDLEQMRQALEMYRADNGYYPAVNTAAFATVANLSATLVTGGYMASIPNDPRGIIYQFRATNLSGGRYYGYCLSAFFESTAGSNTCGLTLPTITPNTYNYGVRQP
jgi:general secretion pathway protein G